MDYVHRSPTVVINHISEHFCYCYLLLLLLLLTLWHIYGSVVRNVCSLCDISMVISMKLLIILLEDLHSSYMVTQSTLWQGHDSMLIVCHSRVLIQVT